MKLKDISNPNDFEPEFLSQCYEKIGKYAELSRLCRHSI